MHKGHKVHLDQVVWLDLKDSQVHKDQEAKKENLEVLVLTEQMEAKASQVMQESKAHR